MSDNLLNPPEVPDCFVCGPANPEGLGLEIRQDGEGAVATFTPRPAHQGYPERMHGGLVAALIDEMLVYAGAPLGIWGMTAKVSYRLRTAIPLEATLTLRSSVTRRSGSGFRAEVEVRLPDGTLAAEGEGTCVVRASATSA
ncbi:MAG: PaaI family thioesterase [Miltoncostaeaceae bacterium]